LGYLFGNLFLFNQACDRVRPSKKGVLAGFKMDAILSFLNVGANKKSTLDFFRSKKVISEKGGNWTSVLNAYRDGKITDSELTELATSLGYNPDEEVSHVVETVSVPTSVNVLSFNGKEGVTQYGMLPFIRFSNAHSYIVCQYGDTELYVALGKKEAHAYFLMQRLQSKTIEVGTPIPAILSSGMKSNGYARGLRRETEGVMKGKWVTEFLTSVHEGCLALRKQKENNLSYSDRVTGIMLDTNCSMEKAREILDKQIEERGKAVATAMSNTSPLSAILFGNQNS
jgi:hypothetical protein